MPSRSMRGMMVAVTANESAVEIRTGRTQPGRCAIEANVRTGVMNTPITRERAESRPASKRLRSCRRRRRRDRAPLPALGPRRLRVGQVLDADPLPLEDVGDREVIRGQRLAVDGLRLELVRARRREVGLNLEHLEGGRHSVLELLPLRVQVPLRELTRL